MRTSTRNATANRVTQRLATLGTRIIAAVLRAHDRLVKTSRRSASTSVMNAAARAPPAGWPSAAAPR